MSSQLDTNTTIEGFFEELLREALFHGLARGRGPERGEHPRQPPARDQWPSLPGTARGRPGGSQVARRDDDLLVAPRPVAAAVRARHHEVQHGLAAVGHTHVRFSPISLPRSDGALKASLELLPLGNGAEIAAVENGAPF